MGRLRFGKMELFDQRVAWVQSIVDVCRAQDVEVIFVSIPFHPSVLVYAGNYQEIHDFFAAFSAQNGVPFYDFNLAKDAWLPHDNAFYLDAQHLNGYGAERFTDLLAQVLLDAAAGEDTSRYFHDTFAQREAEYEGVLGVTLAGERQDGRVSATARAAAPQGVEAEYAFSITRGKKTLYQRDYEASPQWEVEADLSARKTYRLRVYVREKGSEVEYQAQRLLVL